MNFDDYTLYTMCAFCVSDGSERPTETVVRWAFGLRVGVIESNATKCCIDAKFAKKVLRIR